MNPTMHCKTHKPQRKFKFFPQPETTFQNFYPASFEPKKILSKDNTFLIKFPAS